MKQSTRFSNRKQTGLTLVELLVAMAIQFILLAAMVYVYTSSRVMFTVNEQLSRVQENGRYATDTLLYDIRMAGFTGCRSIKEITPNIIANSPPVFAGLGDSLVVYEDGDGWTNPTTLNRVAGSDVITLQSTRGSGVSLVGNMAVDTAQLQINSNPDGLESNDLILISDCSNADLFRATTVAKSASQVNITHAMSTNTDNRLSKLYQDGAQILSFDAHTYFIATGANGEPGLYQYSLSSATATLLAEGIESMQLLLAEDTNGDQEPDIYVSASLPKAAVVADPGAGIPASDAVIGTDWEAIIGIRVGLLLRSEIGVASEPRSYSFNGAEANSGNDTRVRKAFWSYAAMRNKIN
jgi:type IV pilus assembly protein PilW